MNRLCIAGVLLCSCLATTASAQTGIWPPPVGKKFDIAVNRDMTQHFPDVSGNRVVWAENCQIYGRDLSTGKYFD